jgi:hypothetical protein
MKMTDSLLLSPAYLRARRSSAFIAVLLAVFSLTSCKKDQADLPVDDDLLSLPATPFN